MVSHANGRRLLSVVVISLTTLAVSGCIEAPSAREHGVQPDHVPSGDAFDGEIFLLTYTLENLEDEGRGAPDGGHCQRVWMHPDRIVVDEFQYQRILGAEAAIVVDPEREGAWASIGDEAYLLAAPRKIRSHDPKEMFLEFGWHDGKLTIDGVTHALPHEWTKGAEDGSWRLTAEIQAGPDRVDVTEGIMCD